MDKIMFSDVCRLCLTKDNLVWIFDKRFESSENMKDVIYITTGVEITIKDIVSQKICKKCCEVTIKMFEFRRTSLANDRHLREQSLQNLKDSIKIPHTDVTIRSDTKIGIKSETIKKEQPQESNHNQNQVFKVHPTVRALFKVHPQIKLPTVCLKSHIAPFVSLKMDQVENYFKVRKLDMNKYTKLALRSGKVATKKTTSPITPEVSNSCPPSDNLKNAQIGPNAGTSKHRVPPIKIIYNKPHCDTKIDDKVDDTITTTNSSKSSETAPPKILHQESNKRKFHEVEPAPRKKNFKKPAFIESLGLTPTGSAYSSISNSESPAYVANVSVPLHICDICNSVQYSAKDLKKHQHKHLRCQFCKMRFRNLDSKERHIEDTCIIKKTMNNLPDVELAKIECNVEIRRKYPAAFVDFAPLKDDINCSDKVEQPSVVPPNKEEGDTLDNMANNSLEQSSKSAQGGSSAGDPVVIEILSDDEEVSPSASGINKENIVNNNLLKNSATSSVPNAKDKVVITQDDLTKPNAPTVTIIEDNVVYNTVSIVKPDIRIRGNCILDRLDPKLSDTKILKELLSSKPLQLTDDKYVQTDLPTNDLISMNRIDSTTELRQLKKQLYVYKIPVVVKFGPLNVSYNYNADLKRPKKLSLWNDLMPIDIKPNKTVLNNSTPIIINELNMNKNSVAQSCALPKQAVVQAPSLINSPQTCSATTSNSTSPTICTSPRPNITSPKFIRINKSSLVNSNNIDMNPLLNTFLHPVPVTSTTPAVTTARSIPVPNFIHPISATGTITPTVSSIPASRYTSSTSAIGTKNLTVTTATVSSIPASRYSNPTSDISTRTSTVTTVNSIPAPRYINPTSNISKITPTVTAVSSMSYSRYINITSDISMITPTVTAVSSIPTSRYINPTSGISTTTPTVYSIPAPRYINPTSDINSITPTVSSIPAPRFINHTSATNTITPTVTSVSTIPALRFINPISTTSTITPTVTTVSSIPAPISTTIDTPVSTSNVTLGAIRVKNVWELI